MPEKFGENIIGSGNPQDWKENEEGILEFNPKKPKRESGVSRLIGFSQEEERKIFKAVKDLFAKAVMTGKILEPARLIEKSYGRHSFIKTKAALGKGAFREVAERTKRKKE